MHHWHKDRQINQWSKIESRNRPLHVWSVDFSQNYQAVQWQKPNAFNKKCWSNWWGKKSGLSYHIHLRWIIDLIIKAKITKLLKENRRISPQPEIDKDILQRSQKHIKQNPEELDLLKIKNIFSSKWQGKTQTGRIYLQYIYLTNN